MFRFLALAGSLSSVDGKCYRSMATSWCGCEESFDDDILGMQTKNGKVDKPSQEWVKIRSYPNEQNDSPETVSCTLTKGHTKTEGTTWSVGIGSELTELGIKLDGSLSHMSSETWSESRAFTVGTSVRPHNTAYLYQKVVHMSATWSRRTSPGKVIKDCVGKYTFGSNVYQFKQSASRRRRSSPSAPRRRRSSPSTSRRRRSSPSSHRQRSSDEDRNGATAVGEEISPQNSSTVGAMYEEEEEDEEDKEDDNRNGATAVGEEISPQNSSTVGAMDEEEEDEEEEEEDESTMDELATFESQEASNATSPVEELMV